MDPATDWVVGERGYALDFDGTNDLVIATKNPSITTNRLTVWAWIKPAVTTRGDLVTIWTNGIAGSQFNLLYGLTTGKPQFFISTGAANANSGVGATAMTAGRWYCVAGTYDGANIRVYLDGQLQATTASAVTLNTTSLTALRIGNNSVGDGTYQGQVGSAGVADRVLSAGEILLLAQDASPMTLRPKRRVWVQVDAGSDMTGTAAWTWGQSGVLVGLGALAGTSAWTWSQTANVAGLGALTGAAAWVWGETATVTGLGALTGSADWTWTASATAGSPGPMTGAAAWTWSNAGTLSGRGALAGTASWTWTASLVSTPGAMTGTASWNWYASGTIQGCRIYSGCNATDYNYSSPTATGQRYSGCDATVNDYSYTS